MAQITIDDSVLKGQLSEYGSTDEETENFMKDLLAKQNPVPNGGAGKGGEPEPEQPKEGAVPPKEPEAPKEAPAGENPKPSEAKPQEANPAEAQKGGEPQPKPNEPIPPAQPEAPKPDERQDSEVEQLKGELKDAKETIKGLSSKVDNFAEILSKLGIVAKEGEAPVFGGAKVPPEEPQNNEGEEEQKHLEETKRKMGYVGH